MTDYGHDLLFGSFITPSNADPGAAVELAVVTEQAGLDLVTFQDHPYQPRFLDTWTLMSFVTARTTTVRLSANVTNLPLRPPAVLARSVASRTRGSHRRHPGAVGHRCPRRGADGRGLLPAARREAGSGTRPRRRHLDRRLQAAHARVDRPSGGRLVAVDDHLGPSALTSGNAIIDDAAVAAGRSPGDVRRLLNIGGPFNPDGVGHLQGRPHQWVEQLADLALEQGIGTFILAGDDPNELRIFGAQVAPAVRALVARERGVTNDSSPAPD